MAGKPKIERAIREGTGYNPDRSDGKVWYAVVRVNGRDRSTCSLAHFAPEAARRCAEAQKPDVR